ncbi:phospholipase D family protein [Methylobacterium sp. E-025]|uniref:phospholipase D-like domain-containing protein n=1 Tax=Methylobacterium sp. E-025 TaxID=2836561 RepID=UPI001FB912AA|nr:phospholipase D family protein [Methylobacterium sp. E-025]MCJ2113446.1 phospholipase D family protein [Methylobacterium sp. E-025]
MFLTQEELLTRLKDCLGAADRVDIAMAWMSFGEAFSALHEFAKARPKALRAIVGTTGTATHPRALRLIHETARLRLPGGSPLFHPKLIIFHRGETALVWIGSANLTRCGFEQNTEIVAELPDEGGTARAWFDGFWTGLDADCCPRLDRYEADWKPSLFGQATDLEPPTSHEALWAIAQNLSDWPSFVRALRVASSFWQREFKCTVDGEASSWLNTVTLGMEITRRESWDKLSDVDYHVLLGIRDNADDVMGYGLLGSMQGAGEVKTTFLKNTGPHRKIREHIRSCLRGPIHASDAAFPDAAVAFIRQVSALERFGPAVATRLLALARPDRAVSVNNGSRPGLAKLSGLPRSALSNVPGGPRAKSYSDLLAFLSTKEWYCHPKPANRYEQTLANARAALLDCLVYVPTGSETA